MERMTGAIRSLGKGFGFIAGDDGQNYYFHWTGLAIESPDFRELVLRSRVSFGTTLNQVKQDCPRAIDILVIERRDHGQDGENRRIGEEARDTV